MRGADHIGRVLVLGLGKSGKSAARYCASLLGTRVDSLFVAAGADTPDSRSFKEGLAAPADSGCSAPTAPSCHPERSAPKGREVEGPPRSGQPRPLIRCAFGDDALEGLEERFDLCVASPGIPYWHELYRAGERLSAELVSEVEFAWRESAPDSTWVAITGTNGKTTTTALAAHVLRECGFAAAAVGNIGDVCLDAVAAGRTQVYVAEVSSYQLASTRDFAPDVAVLLNITPDHVHWHRTFDAYAQAKFKLIDNLGKTGKGENAGASPAPRLRLGASAGAPVAVLDATNDVVRGKVRQLKAQPAGERGFAYIPMGTADGLRGDMRARCGAENAAFLGRDGMLRVALGGTEHVLGRADDLLLKGEHNVSNALAAAAVAVALGADDARIAAALASFAPLEHRIEPCGSVGGVACYNDSKATNVDSALKALAAFPGRRVAVLLGGDDKGTDLADLVTAVHARAAVAVCFGAAGPRFFEALASASAPRGFACLSAAHLEDALDAALARTSPGDVLLLSPACASFDEFSSFEERGRVFKRLVAERAAKRGE